MRAPAEGAILVSFSQTAIRRGSREPDFVPDGTISLIGAVDLVGMRLFAGVWTGLERDARTGDSRDRKVRRTLDALGIAWPRSILNLPRRNSSRVAARAVLIDAMVLIATSGSDLTEDVVATNRREAEEYLDEEDRARDRFDHSFTRLRQIAHAGNVSATARDEQTGESNPLGPEHWAATPWAQEMLTTGKISIDVPDIHSSRYFTGWVELNRRQLEQAITDNVRAGKPASCMRDHDTETMMPEDARPPQPPALRKAGRSTIHEAILAEYDEAERCRTKPPNLKQIGKVVQARLLKGGYKASGNNIQQLAQDPTYQGRRWPPGRRR
jgi:hypothetical protein